MLVGSWTSWHWHSGINLSLRSGTESLQVYKPEQRRSPTSMEFECHWREAIAKEMKNVKIAFDILNDGHQVKPGCEFLECYMIFDVKICLMRKARFVANGSKTRTRLLPLMLAIVSRETVRIALTYAALNGLDLMAADIQNAYLQAPISVKYWTICGPDF